MRELIAEGLLRLVKPIVALLLAGVLWVLLGAAGATPSPELAVLCWLAGAAFVLLAQDSPI